MEIWQRFMERIRNIDILGGFFCTMYIHKYIIKKCTIKIFKLVLLLSFCAI